jgi:hypothetical protein
VRVLRPGGALALWWNTSALDLPWAADQARRLERHFGPDSVVATHGDGSRAALADVSGQLTEERRHLLDVFRHGVVEETYDVELLVATRS